MAKALTNSRKELEASRRALKRMKDANNFSDFEEVWQDLLARLEKCWNKTKGAFDDGGFAPWRGRHDERRSTDPLLRYLTQARNAEEHTVRETLESIPSRVLVGAPPGEAMYLGHMEVNNGTFKVSPDSSVRIQFIPEGARLVPAVNRGVPYLPPTEHFGKKLDNADPMTVAELGIQYYEQFLEEATKRFGGRKH